MFEERLETSIERRSALELQIVSRDVEFVVTVTQIDSLDGRLRMAEEGN